MSNLWKAEPTMILSVVSAGIALAIGFGAHISTQQMGFIMAFVAAVLGLINRSQVTSPASLDAMTPATLNAAQSTLQPVKDVVRKLPVVVLACVLALGVYGCSAPVTVVTPQGQAAYKADQVVVRVNELMNAAISANAAKALPDATTRLIVQFCVDADKTLAATPAGWQAIVGTAWQALKGQIPPQTNPSVLAAINAADVVLATLGGN